MLACSIRHQVIRYSLWFVHSLLHQSAASIHSINQFTFLVFETHQESQQTTTGKTTYTKCSMFKAFDNRVPNVLVVSCDKYDMRQMHWQLQGCGPSLGSSLPSAGPDSPQRPSSRGQSQAQLLLRTLSRRRACSGDSLGLSNSGSVVLSHAAVHCISTGYHTSWLFFLGGAGVQQGWGGSNGGVDCGAVCVGCPGDLQLVWDVGYSHYLGGKHASFPSLLTVYLSIHLWLCCFQLPPQGAPIMIAERHRLCCLLS